MKSSATTVLGTVTSTSDESDLDLLTILTRNFSPATKQYTADIINKPRQVNGNRNNDDKNDPQNEMKLTTDVDGRGHKFLETLSM